MTVASRLVPAARRLTWEQYAALPEDPRVEYVGGQLLVSPSPTQAHQHVSHRLVELFRQALPPGWEAIGGGRGSRTPTSTSPT